MWKCDCGTATRAEWYLQLRTSRFGRFAFAMTEVNWKKLDYNTREYRIMKEYGITCILLHRDDVV